MNSVPELIQAVESAGGRFVIDGDRLGIFPATAAAPVMGELRRYKLEIIALLQPHGVPPEIPPMPAGCRMIRWEPKPAPIRLTPCETVVDTEKFIRSTLRQLEACLNGNDWLAGNWGRGGLLERLEACGCVVELEDGRRLLQ